MDVICLESPAFDRLIKEVVERVKEQHTIQETWLSTEEAMALLHITSTTTLKKLRDEGKIRFTKPMQKVILYDRYSILGYLEKNAKDTF